MEETHLTPMTSLSIATPTVTTLLSHNDAVSDAASYMSTTNPYQLESTIKPYSDEKSSTMSSTLEPKQPNEPENDGSLNISQAPSQKSAQEKVSSQPVGSQDGLTASSQGESKIGRKRNKSLKKSIKLDPKSKLEKSRQSARECRARKKLRYQYLEDLVCNREKAVVKLREELSTFCQLSKQIDCGTITDSDRQLLTDQTKENSANDS